MKIKFIAIALLMTMISGCAIPVFKTYSGERDISQVSVIEAFDIDQEINLFTEIGGYTMHGPMAKNKHMSLLKFPYGYPKKVQLLPGPYSIQVHCVSYLLEAWPYVDLTLKAGLTYRLGCEVNPQKPSTVRIQIETHESSSSAQNHEK